MNATRRFEPTPSGLLEAVQYLDQHTNEATNAEARAYVGLLGVALDLFELQAEYQTLRRNGAVDELPWMNEKHSRMLDGDDVVKIHEARSLHSKVMWRLTAL